MSDVTAKVAEDGLTVVLPTIAERVSVFKQYRVDAKVQLNGSTADGYMRVSGTTLKNGMSLLVQGAFQNGDAVDLYVQVADWDSGEYVFQKTVRGCKVGPAST